MEWANQMDWDFKNSFNDKDLQPCKYGEYKAHMNLCFVKFRDAGHMVPMDQPELALGMFKWFISWSRALGNNQEIEMDAI